jgi:hypothetical protein
LLRRIICFQHVVKDKTYYRYNDISADSAIAGHERNDEYNYGTTNATSR